MIENDTARSPRRIRTSPAPACRGDVTAEALDQDGWFHTGDLGEIDTDGFLRITDRKKDMFKTSQGKYVAPSAIEVRFKGLCPYVGELLVIGEATPYCVALVSLDSEAITDWAAKHGLAGKSFAEIARGEKTRELIAGYIDTLNLELESLEADQEIHDPGPRALYRIRRPDAEHEAAPQGSRRKVRRRHLGALRTMRSVQVSKTARGRGCSQTNGCSSLRSEFVAWS
jgi:acyl-CoA synthetase (AMP-forming)/AMP-acid ligase II